MAMAALRLHQAAFAIVAAIASRQHTPRDPGSGSVENHCHAVALHFMYYNFVRIHEILRVTPAMAAGVTDRLWEIGDIVKVLEAWEATT
jgi:hypothetical protein